jgi:hypothetical protein
MASRPPEPFSFGIESCKGKYGPDAGARIINAYAEEAPKEAGVPYFIYCRPGLKAFASLSGSGGFRGGIDMNNAGYVVVGQQARRVTTGGGETVLGVMPGSDPVWMARNRKATPQIALASSGFRYLIENDVLTSIADTDLSAAVCVFFQGGYFVWLLADGRFQVSGLDEGNDYDALDFATAEANPDGLIAGCEMGEQIMLGGPKSIEFYLNDPDSEGFPYQRVRNTSLSLGVLAGQSLRSVNGVPLFVASDMTVRQLDGYTPQRISNDSVERDIDALSAPEKMALRATVIPYRGHNFYKLSSANWTWVCDLTTRLWYEWSSYAADRWQAEGFVDIAGKRIVGDYANPELYRFDDATFTDASAHLIWKLVSGPTGQFPNRIIADELYCNLIPGAGLNSSDPHASDPVAMLRVSDDDAHTWSDEMTAPIGRIGEKSVQTSFTGLGASQEDGMRFELSVSAPVARALTGAALRYTPLKA